MTLVPTWQKYASWDTLLQTVQGASGGTGRTGRPPPPPPLGRKRVAVLAGVASTGRDPLAVAGGTNKVSSPLLWIAAGDRAPCAFDPAQPRHSGFQMVHPPLGAGLDGDWVLSQDNRSKARRRHASPPGTTGEPDTAGHSASFAGNDWCGQAPASVAGGASVVSFLPCGGGFGWVMQSLMPSGALATCLVHTIPSL